MKPRSAKNKGRRLQNTVAAVLRKFIPKSWPGTPAEHVKSTTMGEAGVDVQLSPHAAQLLPFSIECKNQEKWSVQAWWAQATANAGKLIPVLILGRNHKNPLVVIDAAVFFELWRKLLEVARDLQERREDYRLVNDSISEIRQAAGKSLRFQFGPFDDLEPEEALPGDGSGAADLRDGDGAA